MNKPLVLLIAIILIMVKALYYMHSCSFENQNYPIGLTELKFEDHARIFENMPRILEVAVWYPTEHSDSMQGVEFGIWKIRDAARNAPVLSNKRLPLIIFSHGYSGNQWVNTWFAEHLAENGYIIAVVRHYGNSYKNMIPELCARPWNRPQDLSFILDQLLQHTSFKNHIDKSRIGVAGFSQGGVAAIWLAGAQAKLTPEILKQQITVVNIPELKMLHFKDIPDERLNSVLDNFTSIDFEQANQSYKDTRFKAAFAIAPGIDEENLMFTPDALSKVLIPVHITIGEADTGLLEQARFFAERTPQCSFNLIPGHVTHMTLLNEGTTNGKLIRPEYTVDHPSIDRGKVHKAVAQEALSFFNKNLK